MTQETNAPNGQTQALTPYQARAMELREEIGQDASPRAIVPRTFAEAQAFASAIAQSLLVPEALRNRAPDVLMMVLAGAELEIPPIRALSLFHVIEGVPKLSADGLAGKILASPLCEYLEPIEQSDTRVTWKGKRKGRPELVLSYTFAEAERAGLTGPTRSGRPSNWMKHPTDMLNARCKARVCRLIWPDLCAGLTTAEEALDAYEGPTGGSGFTSAPPIPPPATPPPANANTTTTAAPSSSKGSKSTSKPKPPIDATATESTSTSTNSAAPSNPSPASTQANASAGSAPTSTASTPPASTSSSSSSSPSDVTSADATGPSSPASTSSPAIAEDESGFGDDETAPAPAGRTIERFESEIADLIKSKNAGGLGAIKMDWLPWSKDESPGGGKQYAQRMRQIFAKAQTDLGIK